MFQTSSKQSNCIFPLTVWSNNLSRIGLSKIKLIVGV